jgi:hypothetical protein
MTDIEQSVKSQFAKVFAMADWRLFKKMAEANLQEAATLLEKDMPIEDSLKLLARNSRKRLLIGVGVELLLKAICLKHGYAINKSPKKTLRFPFLAKDATGVNLVKDKTVMLNELIIGLPTVVALQKKNSTIKGLRIAQVFRNKEGHVVTGTHTFESSNYVDIASSLVDLYRDAFGETLSIQFSLAPDEPAIWEISP